MQRGQRQDEDYLLIASGYLVAGERVLLVHHRHFDKWVPPGGHVQPGGTFAGAAERGLKRGRAKAPSSTASPWA